MSRRVALVFTVVVSSILSTIAAPDSAPASDPSALPNDSRLTPVFSSDRIWNAVTTTRDGRTFVGFPGVDQPGPRLAELDKNGQPQPYPDAAWNSWRPGQNPKETFVQVNAVRIGPDGKLWVVDAGAPGIGKDAVPGAARLISIDMARNVVDLIYPLGGATRDGSYVDDVRFHGATAYLTDAGAPGLIVLDLKTGGVRRVLDGDPSTTDRRPMRADGKVLVGDKGKPLRVHADQIEVSPDGRYVYFQPCSGPLSRIETRWLDDPSIPASAIAPHVEAWLDTPTSGGTAIDADGNIYLSDTDRRRILKIAPDKTLSVLISDPRLIWSDAMWIDADENLWIPATQLNLTPGFNGGVQAVHYPVWIYKMKIGKGPPPGDHP